MASYAELASLYHYWEDSSIVLLRSPFLRKTTSEKFSQPSPLQFFVVLSQSDKEFTMRRHDKSPRQRRKLLVFFPSSPSSVRLPLLFLRSQWQFMEMLRGDKGFEKKFYWDRASRFNGRIVIHLWLYIFFRSICSKWKNFR
jgi:hypothetical protein